MMRNIITVLIGMVIFHAASFAQKGNNQTGNPEKGGHVEKAYYLAVDYNDFAAATTFLIQRIAREPENHSLEDSLCFLYFNRGMFAQTRATALNIRKRDDSNQEILEVLAIAEDKLGLAADAIQHYEKLAEMSGKPYYLYQAAVLQYGMKRIGECEANLQKVILHPDASKDFTIIGLENGMQQKVSLPAAAFNVLGVLRLEANDEASAMAFFNKALEISPEFQLAKNNVAAVNAKKEKK